MVDWSSLLPSDQQTCEGRVWDSGQSAGLALAIVTGFIYLVTAIYRRFWTQVHGKITGIHLSLFLMAVSQAIYLRGNWTIAILIQNVALTYAWVRIYIILFHDAFDGRGVRRPGWMFFWANIVLMYAFVALSAVDLLGTTFDDGTLALAGIPPAVWLFALLWWLCFSPRETEVNNLESKHEKWFFTRVLLAGAIAVLLWCLDFWVCNEDKKWLFLSYPFALLFFAYALLEFTTYLAFMVQTCHARKSAYFCGNWFVASLVIQSNYGAGSLPLYGVVIETTGSKAKQNGNSLNLSLHD